MRRHFLRRVQAGHFLEHATVYGNSYGTLRSEVLDKLRQRQGRAVEHRCAGRGQLFARELNMMRT